MTHNTYVTAWPSELTFEDATFICDMLMDRADELRSWADDYADWEQEDMEEEHRTKASKCRALAQLFYKASQPPH